MQKNVGHLVWRFGVLDDNDKLIASAQIIGHRLPLNKGYLYCPRGPVVDNTLTDEIKQEILKLILSKARDLTIKTTQTEEIFFRLEPILEIRNSKFEIRQTKSIQPSTTLMLDLTQPAEKLLADMHPKNRYNIKLAEKHQIEISELNKNDFENVWPLFNQTSQRDKFNLHPKIYYQTTLATIPWIKLWAAEKDGQILAANLISYFGDTVTYLHGASNYDKRNLMAPHLLQWKIILDAQMLKYSNAPMLQYYDFHGIAETDDPKHPWSGITRFKKGFGGQIASYAGTYDFIYQPLSYHLYKIFRKINLLVRRYK